VYRAAVHIKTLRFNLILLAVIGVARLASARIACNFDAATMREDEAQVLKELTARSAYVEKRLQEGLTS
jgi:hypothetical protein